jgi:hypothetical protein
MGDLLLPRHLRLAVNLSSRRELFEGLVEKGGADDVNVSDMLITVSELLLWYDFTILRHTWMW